MKRRRRAAVLDGYEFTVLGAKLLPGDPAPDAELHGPGMVPKPIKVGDFRGRVLVLSCVPSLDPAVAAGETLDLQAEREDLPGVELLTVSMDLPQAQAHLRRVHGITHQTASSHLNEKFATDYGVLIQESGLLQRAVFVIDGEGVTRYAEYVRDLKREPDEGRLMAALRQLVAESRPAPKRRESAYQMLRDAIVRGELGPGEQIPEEGLADRLGVSRTPLREAVNRLQAEGLVERAANRRLFVTRVSVAEARDLYAVRNALEDLALREAAATLDDDLLAALRRCLDRMERAERDQVEDVAEGGRSFHEVLYHAAGNEINVDILRRLKVKLDRYRYIGTGGGRRRQRQAVDEHRAIYDALAAGDIEKARTALLEHLDHARDEALEMLRETETAEVVASR